MTQQDDITQRVRDNETNIALAAKEWATPENVQAFPMTACAHIAGLADALLSKLRAPVADERVSLRGAANLAFNALHECKPAKGAEKQYSDAIQALQSALHDIAYTVNRTATPQQFADHMQREARAALASAPVAGEAQIEVAKLAEELGDLASDMAYEANQEMDQEKAGRAALIERGERALRRVAYAAPQASAEDVRLRELLVRCQAWMLSSEHDRPNMLIALIQDALQSQPQADKDGGQQRAGVVTDDMRYAVRFAPSSAHWSERLVEFFGPDAREGIDALERQLREARAMLDRQQRPGDGKTREAVDYPRGGALNFDDPAPAGAEGIRSQFNACMHRNECRAMLDRQPKLPGGWQLALNLAIDAIENAAPMDWPVNWPAILHGLKDLRAALSAPQAEQGERDA